MVSFGCLSTVYSLKCCLSKAPFMLPFVYVYISLNVLFLWCFPAEIVCALLIYIFFGLVTPYYLEE